MNASAPFRATWPRSPRSTSKITSTPLSRSPPLLSTTSPRSPAGLDAPRARSAVATFHLDWLGIDQVDEIAKDPTLFPQFTPIVAAAMKDETARFATYVVFDGDRKLETLLTAPYSFPSAPLLDLYGLKTLAPANTPVALDATQRAGILTQPAFLATHSHQNQSSPVQRGKAVREFLFCDPPP